MINFFRVIAKKILAKHLFRTAIKKEFSVETKTGMLIISAILSRKRVSVVQVDYCIAYLKRVISDGFLTPNMVNHLITLKSRKY